MIITKSNTNKKLLETSWNELIKKKLVEMKSEKHSKVKEKYFPPH